jgi:hypothetical protein
LFNLIRLAISFFDRAKGSASTQSFEPSLANMQRLVSIFFSRSSLLELIVFFFGSRVEQLAEALLSLANLTTDEEAREALYMRAQAEGDDMIARELGGGSISRPTRKRRELAHAHARTPRSRSRTSVRMDES